MSAVVRVLRQGGPEVLSFGDEQAPDPGAGEVLVRQTAIGLNYVDVYVRSGVYPAPSAEPFVLGGEAAGEVAAVGPGVADLRVGDRVAYVTRNGGYRAMRVMPASRLVRLPTAVDDQTAAAAMLKGLTVQYLVHDTFRVKPGDAVLVHAAAGGVGLIMGQWLHALGAVAIGTAGGPEKMELARQHGYAHVLDAAADDIATRVRELTGGQGCAVVYDGVGQATYRASLASLRRRGMFVSFGQSSGMITGFSLSDLAAGGSLSATRPSLFDFIDTAEELQARAAALFARLADGSVRIRIGARFPLADVAEAHRALEARKTTGSVVLIP